MFLPKNLVIHTKGSCPHFHTELIQIISSVGKYLNMPETQVKDLEIIISQKKNSCNFDFICYAKQTHQEGQANGLTQIPKAIRLLKDLPLSTCRFTCMHANMNKCA